MTDPARTAPRDWLSIRAKAREECRAHPCAATRHALEGHRSIPPCTVCIHEARLKRVQTNRKGPS